MKSFKSSGLTKDSFLNYTNQLIIECYEITLVDGRLLCWTNFDREFILNSKTFKPFPIRRTSGITQALSLEHNDINLQLSIAGISIGTESAFTTIHAGFFDSAKIKIGVMPINITDLSIFKRLDEVLPNDYFLITIGEINIERLTNNICDIAVRTYEHKLNTKLPRNLYTVACPYRFGVRACTKTSVTTTGKITGASTNTTLKTDLTASSGGEALNFTSQATSAIANGYYQSYSVDKLWDNRIDLEGFAGSQTGTYAGDMNFTFNSTLCTQIKIWGWYLATATAFGGAKVWVNGNVIFEMSTTPTWGGYNIDNPLIIDVNQNITSSKFVVWRELGSEYQTVVLSEISHYTITDGLKPYYRGYIRFTSGKNTGLYRTITNYIKPSDSGGVITVINAFPYTPQINDAFVIYNACDNTRSDCDVKFDNKTNWRGFEYIPTPEVSG